MSDFKSKLPDLKELADITGKFFTDIKKSVCEIVEDYQKKREVDETQPSSEVTSSPPVTPVDENKDKPQP